MNFSPYIGCEQGGIRPAVVVQNEIGNRYSHTMIVAPISTKMTKHSLPTHIFLPQGILEKDSIVLLEQIRTVYKRRIIKYAGLLEKNQMNQIDEGLRISLGL